MVLLVASLGTIAAAMALSWRSPWLLLLLLLLSSSLLPPNYFAIAIAADGGGADGSVKLLATPLAVSPLDSATFVFDADLCSECTLSCKLDNYSSSECQSREVSYAGLHDGDHTFEVCISGSKGIRCDTYNWIVDTVPPTAYISATSPFTSLSNVSVDIVFSEPCTGGGGFRCSSDYCSLLVYGAGHVLPVTLKILQPDLEFSLTVAVSADIQYGRLVLAMDKNFCTDAAGNRFTRSSNSTFFLHVDRRNVFVNLRTHIRQKLLQLNGETRTVEATNNHKNLRIYLYFSEPVINSSAQILNALQTSSGSLSPTNGDTFGNRRFGYTVSNIASVAVITVTCRTSFITTRQGTPVSPSDPYTFLYDAERPSVRLSTTADMRTRERKIPVLVKFVKPVFDFNSSSVFISGGHVTRFREISKSIYNVEVHADDSIVSVEVPENTAGDVAGNRNLASNRLQVRHYSVPTISSLISTITTVVFAATSLAAALLTISTASLLTSGVFSKPATYLISESSRNLLRIAYHIQVFALSKWLAASLPIEYYEFSRGIEWSIPYLSLPWETEGWESFTKDSRPPVVTYSQVSENGRMMSLKPLLPKNSISNNSSTYGLPLTPMEYMSFLEGQNMLPEAEFITHSQNRDRWKYFGRNMFWLAAIGGGLMVLHIALLFILKLRRKKVEEDQNEYGALLFPKFEIFLLFLALPCICQASAAIIIEKNAAGTAVGIVLLGMVLSLLLSLLMFLSVGISLGKLLQYKEVHQEGEEPHWYQELVRVSLGPGKRGQWTWNNQASSPNLTRFGPLFEDLRGPPKYMLSQFVGGGPVTRDQIIASDDETEDAEAPFIQKLFGIMRIYYTLLETVKRVCLGILAGVYSSNEGQSRLPTLVVLSVTAFQLFFIMLKKPFIKRRVQLVEIISVASELLVFVSGLVLLEAGGLSEPGERRLGFLMLAAFVVGLSAQLINEWYSLYGQVVRMSPGDQANKFFPGLKTAAAGILLLLLPSGLVKGLDRGSYVEQGTSSETRDKPWMRQLRELAKESFNKEEDATPPQQPQQQQQEAKDPSTSRSAFWGAGSEPSSSRSGGYFWGGKRSGSSSVSSSTDLKAKGDMKAKARGLYKDLEAIFSSK